MKSAVIKNGKIEIIDISKPDLKGKKGAIVKVEGCGLCGSDIVKFHNATKENENKIKLGHEIVGQIVEINSDVTGSLAKKPFKKGDIIAMGHHYPCFNCKMCRHDHHSMCETFKNSNIVPGGFSEYVYIDENHLKNTVFKKKKNITNEEISFLEPLACCIRAIRRAGYEYNKNNSGSNALVLGLGSIGLLMAQGLKAHNVNVFGYDINEKRQKFAGKFGIKYKNMKFDTIFMTSGSSKAIETALELINNGGKIIVFSSIKNKEGYFNNDIYYKELSVIGSYSPAPSDLALSYKLISNKIINTEGFSTLYSLDNLSKAVDDTVAGKILKAYIKL